VQQQAQQQVQQQAQQQVQQQAQQQQISKQTQQTPTPTQEEYRIATVCYVYQHSGYSTMTRLH
jgi:hypothetical protein